jgi:hypothetical protein
MKQMKIIGGGTMCGMSDHHGYGLLWTKKKPTRIGWYWVRKGTANPEIRRFVRWDSDKGNVEPYDGPYSTFGWDWFAGPLQAPEFLPERTGQ